MPVRRLSSIVVLLLASGSIVACTSSGPTTPGPSGKSVTNRKNPTLVSAPTATNAATRNEVVCKMQREVGSHIPTRICRTRAEMEAAQKAALESFGTLRTIGGDELKRY